MRQVPQDFQGSNHAREALTREQDDEECERVLTLNKATTKCQTSLISQETPHGSCLSAALFNRQFSYWGL
jgi:hypothetical protein